MSTKYHNTDFNQDDVVYAKTQIRNSHPNTSVVKLIIGRSTAK